LKRAFVLSQYSILNTQYSILNTALSKHILHPAYHIDIESDIGYEKHCRPEDTGKDHASHYFGLVGVEIEGQEYAHRYREEYRREESNACEAEMMPDPHEHTAAPAEFPAKLVRKLLDKPDADIAAEIGENNNTRDRTEETAHRARQAHIAGNDSRSPQCKLDCGADKH
jgi:hypothetical protein